MRRSPGARARTLIVAFDHFFVQYRPGQDKPRQLMPDMDAYIERIAKIRQVRGRIWIGAGIEPAQPARDRSGLSREDRRIGPVDALPQGPARSQDRSVRRPVMATKTLGQQQGTHRSRRCGGARVRVSGNSASAERPTSSCRPIRSSRSPTECRWSTGTGCRRASRAGCASTAKGTPRSGRWTACSSSNSTRPRRWITSATRRCRS